MPFTRIGHFTVRNERGTIVKLDPSRGLTITYEDTDNHKYQFGREPGFDVDRRKSISHVGWNYWKETTPKKYRQLSSEQEMVIRQEISEALIFLGIEEVEFY